jgi:hypothetical protein
VLVLQYSVLNKDYKFFLKDRKLLPTQKCDVIKQINLSIYQDFLETLSSYPS